MCTCDHLISLNITACFQIVQACQANLGASYSNQDNPFHCHPGRSLHIHAYIHRTLCHFSDFPIHNYLSIVKNVRRKLNPQFSCNTKMTGPTDKLTRGNLQRMFIISSTKEKSFFLVAKFFNCKCIHN